MFRMSIADVHESLPEEPTAPEAETDEVEEELLVEEISIDGMCGVY
jgi:mycofactocin precursor